MQVTRLRLADMRRFTSVELAPGPGLNLITGDNGAGKTTLLEALHLLAYGRSFRGRVRDGLVRSGAPALEVFAEWQEIGPAESSPRFHRAGLRHTGAAWTGRLDGQDVSHLGELCAALAVVTFEPGSHALVTGGSEARRRLLDWGLFHVEPEFLPLWRRYARALKQRNHLLKQRAPIGQLEPWEHELAAAGETMTRRREAHLADWAPLFANAAERLLPAAGSASLAFLPGWRRDELPLADALLLARERDIATGFTTVGPHRADWRIDYADIPGRDALSRGQAKLSALALLLSQAEQHARLRGAWPVMALDDLASELDRRHQQRVLDWLLGTGAQLFLTGTEAPADIGGFADTRLTKFHVEQGRLRTEA